VVFLCLIFYLAVCGALAARAEVIQLGARTGDLFELKARKFQPGEPLVLTWVEKKVIWPPLISEVNIMS